MVTFFWIFRIVSWQFFEVTLKLDDVLAQAVVVIHNVFCPYIASFLQKYESDVNFILIEIRSSQQTVSYLWGLGQKSFHFSLAFNMVANDALVVSRIWGCYCFRSFWSGKRRRQWWKIEFSGFFFGISTSCLAPFFLYALLQDLTWYLISANLFCSIFVTRPSSRFLLVLIIVCLPATVLVSLNEPALSLTF